MRECNATPDQIEQELVRLVDEGTSLPEAFQAILSAFRSHREFWAQEPEITPGAEAVAHNERANPTFDALNGAAHRYGKLRAEEFLKRIAAEGNGICTYTRTIVPTGMLTLTWVEELVWREDGGDDYNEWWSHRVRSLHEVCPCCSARLASNHHVVAMSDLGPDDKIYRRDPVVHEAKFEGDQLFIKGLRFDLTEQEPVTLGGREMSRRPRVEMVGTGTDEWFEWKDGAYTEYTDRRKPEYSYWLSDSLAAQAQLAPGFTVYGPPLDHMVELGELRATLKS